jgi:hypothetical protein
MQNYLDFDCCGHITAKLFILLYEVNNLSINSNKWQCMAWLYVDTFKIDETKKSTQRKFLPIKLRWMQFKLCFSKYEGGHC